MRKITLEPYQIKVRTTDGEKEITYGIRESFVEILFNPGLKLGGAALLKQNELAEKIMKADDTILLEEEEYQRVKIAIETVEGLGKNDVEFVRRILEAQEISVQEKQDREPFALR